MRTARAQPNDHTLGPQPGQRGPQPSVGKQSGIYGQRMHLIQGEPVTEQGPALRQLGREHGQRMFLDLLLRSVEPPATGIAVPPLRTDDHVRMAALGQPAGQELLRPAVGTGRVDVPDPGRVRSVQHREGPGPQAGNAAVGQVLLTAAGDVRRAAQSGQPQPGPGDHGPPGPERRRGHANPAPAVADHGHYRTGGPGPTAPWCRTRSPSRLRAIWVSARYAVAPFGTTATASAGSRLTSFIDATYAASLTK